jgi:hypothetical protein
VWLKNGAFNDTLELVRARVISQEGYLQPERGETAENLRLRAYRLREQIDLCLRPGVGMELIETGIYAEYRLTIEKTDIAVDESFRELPPAVVCSALRDFLVDNLPEVSIDLPSEMSLK